MNWLDIADKSDKIWFNLFGGYEINEIFFIENIIFKGDSVSVIFSIFRPHIKLPERWLSKGFDSISLNLKLASLNEDAIIRGNVSCNCYVEITGSSPDICVRFYRDSLKQELLFSSYCKNVFLSDIKGFTSI